MRGTLRKRVLNRLRARAFLCKNAKHITKTFRFTDFYFSKVFFFSYYKFIIISIKVFSRLRIRRIRHKKIILKKGLLLWKFFFLAFLCNTARNEGHLKKKF